MQLFISLQQYGDLGILILRAAVGIIFLVHGSEKWKMWKMAPSEQMPAKMLNIIKLLSIVEPLGAIALMAGFLTPFASLGLGIIMLGAIYMKTRVWKNGFTSKQGMGWEFDFLILAVCCAILIFGAGALSLDYLFFGL